MLLPCLRFEEVPFRTPGDRDLRSDLRESPPDFFTRDLDEAITDGRLDAALHSAKDLPDPMPAGLDWCWLPGAEDARDVLVLRQGMTCADLSDHPIVGISSTRRERYVRRRFPGAVIKTVRGTIEDRLRQLDAGDFDLMPMAAAGLIRLGLANRINEWIPLCDLPPPPGQGHLAVTFRSGDAAWLRIRSLMVKPVVFAGAGCGSHDSCTLGAWDALARCDICFHDSLLDAALLDRLPHRAERVDVGKRCGEHHAPQAQINAWLLDAARRGQRVVRLKGGDPGIFGRLGEEIDSLDAHHLPYRVVPGVSSLNAATTGTGLLLTRRGVSHGFAVMTPRAQGGGTASVRADARAKLPMVFFMGLGMLDELIAQLANDGLSDTTPVAVVLDAGASSETVVRGLLGDITGKVSAGGRAGIIIVGVAASGRYHPEWGALQGSRILLPGTDAIQKKSVDAVRDFGGVPIPLPLIQSVPNPDSLSDLKKLDIYDCMLISSPASVHMLIRMLRDGGIDLRTLPKILVAGPGTADALESYGVFPDFIPDGDFGAKGLVRTAADNLPAGARLLRLRSQRAGPELAHALGDAGFLVRDLILYENEPTHPGHIPVFDAVFFASASAVDAFIALAGADTLSGKTIMAMGSPTHAALERHGIHVGRLPPHATVDAAIQTLAAIRVQQEMESTP